MENPAGKHKHLPISVLNTALPAGIFDPVFRW